MKSTMVYFSLRFRDQGCDVNHPFHVLMYLLRNLLTQSILDLEKRALPKNCHNFTRNLLEQTPLGLRRKQRVLDRSFDAILCHIPDFSDTLVCWSILYCCPYFPALKYGNDQTVRRTKSTLCEGLSYVMWRLVTFSMFNFKQDCFPSAIVVVIWKFS